MGNEAINAYEKKPYERLAVVWYETNAALKEGEAVCYNQDYGTATAFDGRRLNRVETPSVTNAQWFAGVAAREYAAVSGGQFIEIFLPGSICNVWSGASTTINVSFLTFDVTSTFEGFFRYEGLPGVGSAVPLQTVDRSSTAGLCMARLMEGPESGGVEVVQLVADTAWVAMVGGSTMIIGVASSSSSPTEEVLDGTIESLLKKVEVITTAATTNEAALDIENNDGITLAGGALASIALGAVGDQVVLQWIGGKWRTMGETGVTES